MLRAGIKPNDLNEVKKLGKPSDIIKLVFDLVGLLKMEKMVKTETAEITMGAAAASYLHWHESSPREVATRDPRAGIGKEKRTFGFIKDSFKNMQGGMLADSSFLKNIFYFSKYEKDMINDETIEFMRARGVDVGGRFFVDFGAVRTPRCPAQATLFRHRGVQHARGEERVEGRGGPLRLDQGHVFVPGRLEDRQAEARST